MNSMGLMLETGFDGKMAEPDIAIEWYRKAHKLGNTDATINLAVVYLNVYHLIL